MDDGANDVRANTLFLTAGTVLAFFVTGSDLICSDLMYVFICSTISS